MLAATFSPCVTARVGVCAQAPIERNVQLPVPIDPRSARALLTLHGLLMVTACAAEPPDTGPGPPSPTGAAPAAVDAAPPAADAAHAEAGLGKVGTVLEERPMEGVV